MSQEETTMDNSGEAGQLLLEVNGETLEIEAEDNPSVDALKDRNFMFVGGALDPLAPPATMCEPQYKAAKALGDGSKKQEYLLINSDHGFNDQRIYLAQKVAEYLADLVE